MKVHLILSLLVTAACAEKKINLEDIERDNLRAESKVKAEHPEKIHTDEIKYSVKPNVNQQHYQIPSQYNIFGGHFDGGSYISSQQFQDLKYSVPPEQYIQPNQYAVHEAQYQQQNQILPQQNQILPQQNQILPQQSIPPIQYYGGYQQQVEVPAKGVLPNAFESQKLNYQPEVVVGNHIQSVQQKAVTEKYIKPVSKGPVYFDIPATQLLSYYPYLNINPVVGAKDAGLVQPSLHPSSNNAVPQISVPVYTPVYNQKPLLSPVKTPYPYPTVVPTTFPPKVTKGPPYSFPITSKKLNSPPLPALPLYVQPQQSQGKKLLYTQAYVAPSQPQYIQQLVYTQPGAVYSDHAAAYSDLYARIPAYIHENSLRGQANQYQSQQQVYVTPTIGPEVPKEVLQEQVNQELPQDYVKVPDEPKTHFVPPQLPAQDFKSGITQLEPVYEDEESLQAKDHPLPKHPLSLLDTYVPSKIIASQDSARYIERPIKLEGGFLPSKTNFAFKKRKFE